MALIPYDDRDGYIWLNGKVVPWREAKVHVLTHALHYGSSVFEGERLYDGVIFKSRAHSERLINSARIMGIDFPYSVDEMEQIKAETVAANGLKNAYVRAFAWRGPQMGIAARAAKVNVAVAAWDWGSYFDPEKREKGIKMCFSKWRRPPADCAPVHAKASGLYMISTLSKHQAEDEGCDDAVMLDYRGYVAEGSAANLFAVKDGALHTPIPDCFLNGLTRQTVIELARDLGITVKERHIKPEELSGFEEVFLTGSAAEITPVGQIAEHSFAVGANTMTRRLHEAYEGLVRAK